MRYLPPMTGHEICEGSPEWHLDQRLRRSMRRPEIEENRSPPRHFSTNVGP